MARRRRINPPGAVYHVINRSNRRRTIFYKAADYQAFLNLLVESLVRRPMRIIAFCIMPNHWHLILWPTEEVSLSAYMHWLTGTHVRRYHAHYGLVGTGHLYQDRYRSHMCQDDQGLLRMIRYVEANPRQASLVERAEDWPWSSLALRVNNDPEGLLCECPIVLPADWSAVVNERKTDAPIL